jgi:CubicO group peptidase (beta-lactamase class C family)
LNSDVHSEIEELRRSGCIPGGSIAVVDQSELIGAGGFGFADLRRGLPATPETVYHLFSGTKLFTAVAVLQPAERELLGLDERVTVLLPDFSSLLEVRLVHLLSHCSGLRDTLRGFLAVTFPPESLPSTGDALSAYR